MRNISTRVLAVLAAVFVLASCGKIAEKATEKAIEESAGGGDADIDSDGSFSFESDEGSIEVDDEGNMSIESEDGSYTVDGSTGELPEDFPDVPLPDVLEIQSSSTQSDDQDTLFSILGQVPDDDADAVFADMLELYEDGGFEVEGRYENTSGGDFTGGAQLVGSKHTVAMSVFGATGDDEGTTVSLTLTPTAG